MTVLAIGNGMMLTKGIRRVGVKLANLLNPVPIPPGTFYKFMQVLGLGGVCKLFFENEIAVSIF